MSVGDWFRFQPHVPARIGSVEEAEAIMKTAARGGQESLLRMLTKQQSKCSRSNARPSIRSPPIGREREVEAEDAKAEQEEKRDEDPFGYECGFFLFFFFWTEPALQRRSACDVFPPASLNFSDRQQRRRLLPPTTRNRNESPRACEIRCSSCPTLKRFRSSWLAARALKASAGFESRRRGTRRGSGSASKNSQENRVRF